MDCLNCKATLSDGAKFCIACGAPSGRACPSCKLGNPPGAKFCANCGASLIGLASTARTSASLAKVSLDASAERRHLTVMFCDIVGSTALSTELDPEDLGSLIADFRTACTESVTPFGGKIAQYMGDGALVYFGYPEAYEDAPARAILAALALVEAARELRQSSPGFPQLRAGIATGMVVVRELTSDGESHERVAVGETPNLAARLQALAAPDSVVISESTWNLTGNAFNYEDLGPQTLKGIPMPVRAWAVLGESSANGRFAARAGRRSPPLVGRADEIAMIRQRWGRAVDGDGQVILLSAPAGMGKSRMTRAFLDSLGEVPPACIQFFCSPYHSNSALYPLIRQLEFSGESPAGRLGRSEARQARGRVGRSRRRGRGGGPAARRPVVDSIRAAIPPIGDNHE